MGPKTDVDLELVQQVFEAVTQLRGHRLVARHRRKVGRGDVVWPVRAENHPRGEASVDGHQVLSYECCGDGGVDSRGMQQHTTGQDAWSPHALENRAARSGC